MTTPAPTRKVTAGALGGAVAVILVWLLRAFTGVEPPAEVSAALATVCSFACGYLVRA